MFFVWLIYWCFEIIYFFISCESFFFSLIFYSYILKFDSPLVSCLFLVILMLGRVKCHKYFKENETSVKVLLKGRTGENPF